MGGDSFNSEGEYSFSTWLLIDQLADPKCETRLKSKQRISNAREVWVSLLERLSRETFVPPVLNHPIGAYTAQDLERLVMRRISSEIRSREGKIPRRRACFEDNYPFEHSHVFLAGGRWFLGMAHEKENECGRVYAYNLDGEDRGQCIIDLGILHLIYGGWLISCDTNMNELSYTISLTPTPTSPQNPAKFFNGIWPREGAHIYSLTVKGRGAGATLEAKEMKYLRFPKGHTTSSCNIVLAGNYIVRQLGICFTNPRVFEVWNWALSNDSF
ncbi:hypothetical protein BDN70DRAFT_956551 [Pholiota conissans]|uniref:Uncharacterized protein n=1 Tax=Pholiota conissans TaxID=109636 RepID=A0A9P5YTD0_9AGAR|nr:hypothetical protein BDN70DRAFT_956551 [Pholiota conissans]